MKRNHLSFFLAPRIPFAAADLVADARARTEINSHFGASAGGQVRGAATRAMPGIVEDPELRSGRAPPPHSGTDPLGFVARSSHTTPGPGIARRSRLASGPCGPAAKCESISVRALSSCRPAGGGIRYRIYEITYLARNLVKVPA